MVILVLKCDVKLTLRKWHLLNALSNYYCSDSNVYYAYQQKQFHFKIDEVPLPGQQNMQMNI